MIMAHCAACHITFGGVGTFDVHRNFGRCSPPQEQGLTYNKTRRCWTGEYDAPLIRKTATDVY